MLALAGALYYACAMTKRLSGRAKKWFIIGGMSLLLVGGGVGGYLWYQRYQQLHRPASEQEKQQAAQYTFTGDQDIAARYVALVKADKVTDAQQLFVERVKAEKDTQKKVALYVQNINLALSLKKTDAALDAANRLVAVRASHDTYAQLANVYIARGEPDQQIDALQKAIDALKAAPNVPNKDDLMKLYQSQLDAAREFQAMRSKYAR